MRYFILGVCGMAGHTIALYLSEQGHQVTGFARQPSPVCETILGDAFQTERIQKIIEENEYDVVVNCIGILNKAVDDNLAAGIFINSYFPHFIAQCCDSYGTKLIHISTDCVFSGNAAGYVEADIPDETSYYGRTKFLGEVSSDRHLCIRTSIVGPELKKSGIGLFHWFMHQKEIVEGYAHVKWTGVTTLELAKAVEAASKQELSGLYFLTNNIDISKYELLKLFNQYCRNNSVEITRGEEPINSKVLVCTRTDFNYFVPNYEDMVKEMSEWINEHKTLYGQYLQ